MLCAHCLAHWLHADPQGPQQGWEIPAAVTVYNGEALCRVCFRTAITEREMI